MWQEVRKELHPKGLELVTVALETRGADRARPYIEAAKPEHPSLIDPSHLLGELFGVVNVPSGIWIDEEGTIVRPPETAYPAIPNFLKFRSDFSLKDATDPYLIATAIETAKIRIQPRRYMNALRDWVDNGRRSRFRLSPDEVVRRSRGRTIDEAKAVAHFEIGQHLHRAGNIEAAQDHFRQAHRLDTSNWTYRRQAWSMVKTNQSRSDVYDSDWVTDVRKVGAENYYARLDMPD